MKIGVISDIHSNIIAFKVCTAFLENEGCDEYLFLGDYISDTPYAREAMDYLYEFIEKHPCHLLRGNREEYMISQRSIRRNGISNQMWIYNSASGNLLYTYERLTEEDLDFFEKLPISFVYEKEGYPTITCCHGSPENARELLQLESDRAKDWLDRIDTDYMICSHTHYPGECTYKGKHYYNSGCVGIAIEDYGYAQCMILEDCLMDGKAIWRPEFLKIPYDNKKVVEDICKSGLLEMAPWFINSNIQILLTGIDNSAKMVMLASELAREAGEKTEWPLIAEEYFEMAAKQLGIPDYRKGDIFKDGR